MTEKEAKAKLKEIKKAMDSFPKEVRRQERAHREEMKIQKAFGKISFFDPYESLKAIWKKLKVNGQVKNFSSKELWTLEADSGKPIARRLPSGFKTPPEVDCDAFKRTDNLAIEGHNNWWKFYDFSTVEIFNQGSSIKVSVLTKTAVTEDHFGKPIYKNETWGSPIYLVTDVKRNRKRQIIEYFVSNVGWISTEKALTLACNHEIDNARPVFPNTGKPYLRTKRDRALINNIDIKGRT